MAFDQSTRNRLARFVSDTRALLTEEFTRQLQHVYGLDPETGDVTDPARLTLDNVQRETARLLRETMEHYLASADTSTAAKAKKTRQETLDRIVREQAFTVLNRLCALRMAEARGLLIESIAKGYQSKGFQLYQRLAGTALGETGDCYRVFLFSVFDEFAVDLPVLFDRFSPQGRLFPRETALLAVLDQINHPDIDPLWAEDETIGWIYQYFNSVEERRQMRAESQAPRNSRELAVRNQFFTPRYVVEFLTDNTLGRIWYEMTKGQTALKDSCRYLVRRPNEIFLAEGEEAPEQEQSAEDLSQEELLKQPVYIPHRPLKDPRDIKMLDPACGSMHFGLYAFDLFERIYDEAWDLEAERGADAFIRPESLKPLHETYDSKEAFLRDVPRLIIERNIHGIDIDPRAVQIAALSLWLRAQKSWQLQGLASGGRPQIQRSNIVCAEPMPGEADMLEEFIAQLQPKVLGQLVRLIFDKMKLAGEAGSLLRIEEDIQEAVSTAHEEYQQFILQQKKEKGYLPGMAPERDTSLFDFADLPSEDGFWNRAEALVLSALADYAEHAEGITASRRRMFSNDAARGFAFIDLCRRRFDTVLMNPPYGAPASGSRHLIAASRIGTVDLYAAFMARGIDWLGTAGRMGALTSRTFLYFSTFEKLRRLLTYSDSGIPVIADLGFGVLDDAMVETCATVAQKHSLRSNTVTVVDVIQSDDKALRLAAAINSGALGDIEPQVYVLDLATVADITGFPFPYWVPPTLLGRYKKLPAFQGVDAIAKPGSQTGDNEQYLRLMWEVPDDAIGKDLRWAPYAKGGDFSRYYGDIHLVVNWSGDGSPLSACRGVRYLGRDSWFCPGLTYPLITVKGFNVRVLPAGCIWDNGSPSIFPTTSQDQALYTLGLLNSRLVQLFLYCVTSSRHWQVGYLSTVPWVPFADTPLHRNIARVAERSFRICRALRCQDETDPFFTGLPLPGAQGLRSALRSALSSAESLVVEYYALQCELDRLVAELYELSEQEVRFLNHTLVWPIPPAEEQASISTTQFEDMYCRQVNAGGPSNGSESEEYEVRKRMFFLEPASDGPWRVYASACRLGMSVEGASELRARLGLLNSGDVQCYTKNVLSMLFGCIVGRWDNIDKPQSGDPGHNNGTDVFEPLTARYARKSDDSESSRAGLLSGCVLVNDPDNRYDVIRCLRSVLDIARFEQEACEALSIASLRDYFSRVNAFFQDHLNQYSKSRRSAPIYWPLSTPSGSYTLWLYYHRLTDQTLYTCVNDFVDPKLKQVSEEAGRLRGKSNRSSAEEKELERLSDLELELKDFRDELLRIAKFWKPNLNDGVQITAAPLWKLFQHRQWRNRLKETWEKLEAGEYDWAHLALSIWPERVVRACQKDRSYAIAHDLEDRLWHEVQVGTDRQGNPKYEWQPRNLSEDELNQIIAEVKAR